MGILLLLLAAQWVSIVAVPFRFVIPARATECFWQKLEVGEQATFSAFILEGTQLKATLALAGPFADPDVEDTAQLLAREAEFADQNKRWTKHTIFKEIVDFEHLQPEFDDEEDEEEEIEFEDDDDDDDAPRNGETIDDVKERIKERRKRRMETRRKIQAARQRRRNLQQQRQKEQAEKMRNAGDPHQKTIAAKAPGWFRGCITASYNQIKVELEFRHSKELGGVDPTTQHVYSYEKYQEMQEEKLLDEDTPEDEPSIKVEDFATTRNQMRELRRALNQISSLQHQARNRMQRHAELGMHSHSKMTQNSLFMTALFILVTVFQVYTIQKWFSSGNASLLAR